MDSSLDLDLVVLVVVGVVVFAGAVVLRGVPGDEDVSAFG